MCAKLLDYQFPIIIHSDILKYGIGSIRETDGYDELRTADDTAGFFAGNFELVIRISDHERYDLYLTFLFLVVYKLNNLDCALFCLCNGSTISRETGDEQFTT